VATPTHKLTTATAPLTAVETQAAPWDASSRCKTCRRRRQRQQQQSHERRDGCAHTKTQICDGDGSGDRRGVWPFATRKLKPTTVTATSAAAATRAALWFLPRGWAMRRRPRGLRRPQQHERSGQCVTQVDNQALAFPGVVPAGQKDSDWSTPETAPPAGRIVAVWPT